MADVVSSGDDQDGGGCFLGEITKMVEDVHTERLLVTMLKRPLTRDRFMCASHKTYNGLVSR